MPKLDGVTATNMIRQFDPMTPIISMTSNSKPNDILHYYSSGMNDILPKPFTKEGLLDMLEVCSDSDFACLLMEDGVDALPIHIPPLGGHDLFLAVFSQLSTFCCLCADCALSFFFLQK
jgi:FixJ family two-component response regulator